MTFTKNIICVKSQLTQKNKQVLMLHISEPATENLSFSVVLKSCSTQLKNNM